MSFSRITLQMLLLAGTTLFLLSCTPQPPECSDKDVQSMVNQIITDATNSAGAEEGYEVISLNIDMIRSNGFDKASNTRSCTVNMTLTTTDETQNEQTDLHYTVQLSDNKKEFIVKITGADE